MAHRQHRPKNPRVAADEGKTEATPTQNDSAAKEGSIPEQVPQSESSNSNSVPEPLVDTVMLSADEIQ